MTSLTVARRAPNPERRFYLSMVSIVIATIVLGFARSFFLRPLFPGVHAPHEIWFYLHGVVFTAWLALLFSQAWLMSAGNPALHKRLGVAAYALVPLMIFMGLVGSLIAARRPGGFIDIPVPPLKFLIVPIYDIALFAGFAGSALLLRRRPQFHKRLMLLSTIALAEAGIARWPFEPYLSGGDASVWTLALFLLPMIAWDLYSQKRPHPATLIGALFLLTEAPLRNLIMESGSWLRFARWATGLLG